MSAGVALAWATEALAARADLAEGDRRPGAGLRRCRHLRRGRQAHRQPADRLLPGAGARRRPRRVHLRRRGLRPGLWRQRDARLPHRPGLPPGLPDRRAPQPPGQRGLQPRPEGRPRAARRSRPTSVADALLNEERWRQVLTSLVVCFFARGVYTADVCCRRWPAAGFDLDAADLARLGAETLRRKYAFKEREGFDLAEAAHPAPHPGDGGAGRPLRRGLYAPGDGALSGGGVGEEGGQPPSIGRNEKCYEKLPRKVRN